MQSESLISREEDVVVDNSNCEGFRELVLWTDDVNLDKNIKICNISELT